MMLICVKEMLLSKSAKSEQISPKLILKEPGLVVSDRLFNTFGAYKTGKSENCISRMV